MTRLLWLTGGWFSLGLGIAGIFLPLLPTTPFVLLTACCFSRGSERLHQWLICHQHFGKTIQNWERDRSISLATKWTATILLPLFLSYPLLCLEFSLILKGAAVVVGASVLTFIWQCKTSVSRTSDSLSTTTCPE